MAKLRPSDAELRRGSDAGPDFSEALARGLKIVTAFEADRRQMTLSEIARAVDLPRATARRALHTLNRLGYVETDGRLFRLTPRILRLATAYLGSNAVSSVLQPACEALTVELQEACSAAVLDGDEVVMIAHASPCRFMASGPGIGFRLPAFCTALGRVLLAGLPEARLEAYFQTLTPVVHTDLTLIDRSGLRDAVARCRESGFALVDQEAELGFRSVAVPVRRYDGAVAAALNIGARVERANIAALREVFLPKLRTTAALLQEQLL